MLFDHIPRSSGWIPRSYNGRAMQVEKKYPRNSGCSVPDVVKQKCAFKHTWFSNNKGFYVWKSQAAIQSFTFNFVKLLYLIIWEARTNLKMFYCNFLSITTSFDFQTKSFVIWEPSMLKSRFLLINIRDTAELFTNSWKVLYMVQIPIKSDQISTSISKYAIK